MARTRGGDWVNRLTDEDRDRLFWEQVDTGGDCWLWVGATTPSGYGTVTRRGRSYRSHRIAFEMAFGPIPEGSIVCHRCDVRACVRPDHLYAGTAKDNARDRAERGNQTRLGRRRYTDEQRARALDLVNKGHSQTYAANTMGMSQSFVNNLVSGKRRVLL